MIILKIRELCKQKQISLKDLSYSTGISRLSLFIYCTQLFEESKLNLFAHQENLRKIARYLNCSVANLKAESNEAYFYNFNNILNSDRKRVIYELGYSFLEMMSWCNLPRKELELELEPELFEDFCKICPNAEICKRIN
ncbi:helix-turn-helix transcriptional regulator [Oxynema sp. CENA135]|uniref:helix-turn-helix domain-containing protein n=1 Tax=Oxynema sp. CENA135 TaxID=984206 RepID=UPI00190D4870|nr:helix-turn-helix transcriptional regulator [Oxynema sp. CENA135]MBK4729058.1 helix-turn-helix transcriptional regulator [Oxynema sp. CENA135]